MPLAAWLLGVEWLRSVQTLGDAEIMHQDIELFVLVRLWEQLAVSGEVQRVFRQSVEVTKAWSERFCGSGLGVRPRWVSGFIGVRVARSTVLQCDHAALACLPCGVWRGRAARMVSEGTEKPQSAQGHFSLVLVEAEAPLPLVTRIFQGGRSHGGWCSRGSPAWSVPCWEPPRSSTDRSLPDDFSLCRASPACFSCSW